jgi:hypothetical protein
MDVVTLNALTILLRARVMNVCENSVGRIARLNDVIRILGVTGIAKTMSDPRFWRRACVVVLSIFYLDHCQLLGL